MNKEFTTPVSPDLNRIYSLSGEICFAYTEKTLFKVARITNELFEDESYQYIFEPYYDVIDGLEHVDWGGIPGIDLSKRQEKYYRVGMIPTFISERTPPANRVNLQEELRSANLEYLNSLQWLINTNTVYSGDKLLVKKDGFNGFTGISKRSAQWHALSILQLLGMRLPIDIDGRRFGDGDRSTLIKAFLIEYEFLSAKRRENQSRGQLEARESGIYTGRKPIVLSIPLLAEVKDRLASGQMTLQEALQITKLSKATLYRKFKKLKSFQM
ncbi:MAG: hypothetical protein AB9828_06045 [Sphaerochaetaceae bacterium]